METPYQRWVREHDTLTDADRAAIRRHIAAFAQEPLISVVMPTYNPSPRLLAEAIASVQAQLYPHWELCIADDASPDPAIWPLLQRLARADGRIRPVRRPVNGHISAATNTALGLATGTFVALMDHDDLLPEHALYQLAAALDRDPALDVIYSDEDHLNGRGLRDHPYFKPDWDPDLLHGHNVISHLGAFRRTLLERIGGCRLGFEGSQDYDLALRATAATTPDRIRHIPAVLYHWRRDAEAPSFSESWLQRCLDAAHRALREHLDTTADPAAEIIPIARLPGWHLVRYPVPSPPPAVDLLLVGEADAAAEAARVIEADTDYPGFRIHQAGWAGLDAAVRGGTAPLVAILSADLAAAPRDWLRALVGQACRPTVGAVGAKLLDGQGRVLHAGFLTGPEGVRPVIPGAVAGDPGYYGQLMLARSLAAVSAEAMVFRRAVFEEVGGFDPALSPGALEADWGQRLADHGYRVVWDPAVQLTLHDTVPQASAAEAEGAVLRARWGEAFDQDGRQNPNLRLDTAPETVPVPPRQPPPWAAWR